MGLNFRRVSFAFFLSLFAFASIVQAPFASSAETSYQVVVHVPGVVGVVPGDASVVLTDSTNSSNQSPSRLIGQDSYGWFGVVDVPAGANAVKVAACAWVFAQRVALAWRISSSMLMSLRRKIKYLNLTASRYL